MEILTPTYYDQSKWSNTLYLIFIAIETFFANNVFRSDLTRVFYASPEYCFRQRLNLLAKGGTDSIQELQLPFMNYFREENWKIDDRAAIMNATAALTGFPDASVGYQNLRFLQVMADFSCVCWGGSDSDAQMMYETLLWIQQPSPKQFPFGSMTYLGSSFDIPIHLSIKDLKFNPNSTEKDWLKKNRIFPITFTLGIKSVVLAQSPQSPESNVFYDQSSPVITKQVILDYLSYKNQNSYTDLEHIDFEVTGSFNNDPDLNGNISVSNTSNTSITVNWTFNLAALPNYNTTVTLNVNSVLSIDVPIEAMSYTFNDLEPQSTYNIAIWFTSTAGQVNKYYTSAVTGVNTAVVLKGMVGR